MKMRIRAVSVFPERLFLPGALIWRWTESIRRETSLQAKRAAPVNKRARKSRGAPPRGSLRKSIRATKTVNPATLTAGVTLSANVPYASYVHEGTKTILARDAGGRFTGKKMYLPPNLGYGPLFKNRVRGQDANPFLVKGVRKAALKHSSLRGM